MGRAVPTPIRESARLAARRACLSAALCVMVVGVSRPAGAQDGLRVEQDGRVLHTPRHRIEVGDAGLPWQIFIKPTVEELPLELRDEGAEVTDAQRVAIGRGPRLAGAIHLRTKVDGNSQLIEPGKAATVSEADGGVTCQASASVGGYTIDWRVRYTAAGVMHVEVTTDQTADTAAPLELVVPLQGQVNLLFRGLPDDFAVGRTPAEKLDARMPTLPEAGQAWASAPGAAADAVAPLYIGSPDAGFAWQVRQSWPVPDGVSLATIDQDDMGLLTWRLVLRAGRNPGRQTHAFALGVLPAGERPAGHRKAGWLDWPADTARALAATTDDGEPARPFNVEPGGYRTLSQIGAAIASPQNDHIAGYPNSLMQVLLAPAAAQANRIHTNTRAVVPRASDLPGADRQVIGRALLHDAGVGIAGLAQPVEYLRTVQGLRDFGYFDPTGTEFLPYWRSDRYIRFGEAFDPASGFNLSKENPARDTYVSVYRRRIERDGRAGIGVMFVIVNQQPQPARAKLYVLDPQRIFGSGDGSQTRGLDGLRRLDFGDIPEDGDWRRSKIANTNIVFDERGLRDLEDDGFVIEHSNKGLTGRVYGPVFIPAKDFRILYGQWLAEPANDKQR